MKEDKHHCKPDFVENQLQIELETCVQKVTNDCTVPIPRVVREAVADIKDKGLDLIKKIPNQFFWLGIFLIRSREYYKEKEIVH